MLRSHLPAVVWLVLWTAPQFGAAQDCRWVDVIQTSEFDDYILASVLYDEDGAGPREPALFVAGSFTSIDGQPFNRIARWDGSSWTSLSNGVRGTVFDMAVFDDGSGEDLYVIGAFVLAGTKTVNRIAKWNGEGWSQLDFGLDETGYSLAVYDPDGDGPLPAELFAGGLFNSAGQIPVGGIARWGFDPNQGEFTWSDVGSADIDGPVYAIQSCDLDGAGPAPPELYIGGNFSRVVAGVNNIARWNAVTETWNTVGTGANEGVSGTVHALEVWDVDGAGPGAPALFVGGFFSSAGAVGDVHNVAKWDGSNWHRLGSATAGTNERVYALRAADVDGAAGPATTSLYVGGIFTAAGGSPATAIAEWNGTSWSPLDGGFADTVRTILPVGGGVGALAGPALYVGGKYTPPEGPLYGRLAYWTCEFQFLEGDVDGDGDVDGNDFQLLAGCISGPGVTTPPPGCNPEHFDNADLDFDGDVDIIDLYYFQSLFGSGS